MCLRCVNCQQPLQGKQTKYCSRSCKNAFTNQVHQSYLAQQKRGRLRKLRLVELGGGSCSRCGYARNYAALEFHHLDASTKGFALDLRALSNRRWQHILIEVKKCVLLCSNCHAEVHNPDCIMSANKVLPSALSKRTVRVTNR